MNTHTPPAGRPAVPELVEMLQQRVRPAASVAAGVVVVALVLTLVAPSVLPANALIGALVGLLALVAGTATGVVADGRDPVVRGPRHLRRDGHVVLARLDGPDLGRTGGALIDAIARRTTGDARVTLAFVGGGLDLSAAAVAVGMGVAARGTGTLVMDLRATDRTGVGEVASGQARLGEVAERATDRPYAWIAGGATGAAAAAAAIVARPPRDVKLLIVVAPDVPTTAPEALRACGRAVVFIPSGVEQRSTVTTRLASLARLEVEAECVVVDPGPAPVAPMPGAGAVAAAAPSHEHVDPAVIEPPVDAAKPHVGEVAAAPSPFADRPAVLDAPEMAAAPVLPDLPRRGDVNGPGVAHVVDVDDVDGTAPDVDDDPPSPGGTVDVPADRVADEPEADGQRGEDGPTDETQVSWEFRSSAGRGAADAALDLRTAATLAFLDADRGTTSG